MDKDDQESGELMKANHETARKRFIPACHSFISCVKRNTTRRAPNVCFLFLWRSSHLLTNIPYEEDEENKEKMRSTNAMKALVKALIREL